YPQMFQGQKPDPDKEKALKAALTYLDSCVEKSPYVAGEHLTIADLALGASLTLAEVTLGSISRIISNTSRDKVTFSSTRSGSISSLTLAKIRLHFLQQDLALVSSLTLAKIKLHFLQQDLALVSSLTLA
ncbi:glutathione S-transferase D2-like, partial [Limulus polyphemus]|uniref:Glutathione S-transferase D2-like n=1 Tax=Limulus polyphemus TaxID=6850 RepID=A0ABM1C4C8_LIMPO